MKELWKKIDGVENYFISNIGNAASNHIIGKKGRVFRVLSKRISRGGYEIFNVYIRGKLKTLYIHREMTKAFIASVENKNQVNHIDGVKTNNYLSNLEWCDASENQLHAVHNNLTNKKFGLNHWNNKLDECQLLTIITMLPVSDACIRRIRKCESSTKTSPDCDYIT